nr:MAG TPA: hypothetical protein [Caudoviricetes sp.]
MFQSTGRAVAFVSRELSCNVLSSQGLSCIERREQRDTRVQEISDF